VNDAWSYVYDAAGRRIEKATPGEAVYYLYDLAGHVVTELKSSGGWNRGGAGSDERHRTPKDGGDVSPLHFTGKERDSESGLDNFGARYDSSSMGRFMSPDPLPWLDWQRAKEGETEEEQEEDHKRFENWIANPQNFNMYAYVDNNPLSYTDPTGMSGCKAGDKTFTTCTITIVYNPQTSQGTLTVTGQNKGDKSPTVLLTTDVVVGGDGHVTPTGTFTAMSWQKDHVSTKFGTWANTPWSKSPLGLNVFGPFQLHIKELDSRGIYIHGTLGPSWNPFTFGNRVVGSTSHGCIRMCNSADIELHNLMPEPAGNKIVIRTAPDDNQ
jgi:RHS repeat-associated protein